MEVNLVVNPIDVIDGPKLKGGGQVYLVPKDRLDDLIKCVDLLGQSEAPYSGYWRTLAAGIIGGIGGGLRGEVGKKAKKMQGTHVPVVVGAGLKGGTMVPA